MLIFVSLLDKDGNVISSDSHESGCRELLLHNVANIHVRQYESYAQGKTSPFRLVYPKIVYRFNPLVSNEAIVNRWLNDYVPIFERMFKVRMTVEITPNIFLRRRLYNITIFPNLELPVSFCWSAFWWLIEWLRPATLRKFDNDIDLSHSAKRVFYGITKTTKTFPYARLPSDMELLHVRYLNGIKTWRSYRINRQFYSFQKYMYIRGITYGFTDRFRKDAVGE